MPTTYQVKAKTRSGVPTVDSWGVWIRGIIEALEGVEPLVDRLEVLGRANQAVDDSQKAGLIDDEEVVRALWVLDAFFVAWCGVSQSPMCASVLGECECCLVHGGCVAYHAARRVNNSGDVRKQRLRLRLTLTCDFLTREDLTEAGL